MKAQRDKLQRERKQRAPEDINRDTTWDRLMARDGVTTDTVPTLVDRYRGRISQRGGVGVLATTCLHTQRERDTLHRQLDLAHAHADFNG